MPDSSFFTVGGTVQAAGGIYIPRRADEQLFDLCRKGEFAYVLTPRQMGKSSLMMRTAEQLQTHHVSTAIIDLTQIGVQVTAEQWYLGLLVAIEDNLWLETDVITWWQENEHIGYTQRFTLFFEEILLKEIKQRVVIFVDEIDTTLTLAFTDDFYGAIRYLYNSRSNNPELKRLSFVLIGVAVPGDLITDPQRTPFNVGRRVDLTDFTYAEAKPLAAGFEMGEEQANQVLQWILDWTGGHPYLTQRLCLRVTTENRSEWTAGAIAELVNDTYLGEMSRQDNNLQFVRDMLTERAPEPVGVIRTYERVWRGRDVVDEEQSVVKSHLKLSGVVKRDSGLLRVRNQIYNTVFDGQWIAEHRPPRYWTPVVQRIAIGAIIVLFIITTITSVVAVIAADSAFNNEAVAETRAAEAIAARETSAASEAEANNARSTAEASEAEARAAEQEARDSEAEARAAEDVAQQQANLAAIALASQLAAQSQVLADTNPQQSLLLALEGMDLATNISDEPSLTAQNALYQALAASSGRGFALPDVTAVDIAANGEWLFATYRDRSLWAWEQNDPTAVPRLLNIGIGPIALSQDGEWLAHASDDGLFLWQTNDLTAEAYPLYNDTNAFEHVLFSPNKNWLAAIDDGDILLWDLSRFTFSGDAPDPYRLGNYTTDEIGFNFESTRFAVEDNDRTNIPIWDLTSPPPSPSSFTFEPSFVVETTFPTTQINFVPNLPLFIEASLIWNVDEAIRYNSPFETSSRVVFSQNGNWVVAIIPGEGATVFGANELGEEPVEDTGLTLSAQSFLLGENAPATTAVFSNNNRWLALGLENGRVLLFDLQDKQSIFLDDSPFAGADTLPPDYQLSGLVSPINTLTFSPDNEWLAAVSENGNVRRWRIQENVVLEIPDQLATPLTVNFNSLFLPESEVLVQSGAASVYQPGFAPSEGILEGWDFSDWPEEPTLLFRHEGLRELVNAQVYSPDGEWIAAASVSAEITRPLTSTIHVWNTADIEQNNPLTLAGPSGPSVHLATGNNGEFDYLIAAGGLTIPQLLGASSEAQEQYLEDGASAPIYVWDIGADDPEGTRQDLEADSSFITRLRTSENGRWLAVSGVTYGEDRSTSDTTIEVWDLTNLDNEKVNLRQIPGDDDIGFVDDVRFSPDSRWLVAAYYDGSGSNVVSAWDLTVENWATSSSNPTPVTNFASWPFSIAFSPDSRWLAVANPEGLMLFDTTIGFAEPVETLPLTDFTLSFSRIGFSEDGRFIVLSNYDNLQAAIVDLAAADFERSSIILTLDAIQASGTTNALFSPENDFLVTSFFGGPPQIWSLDTEYLTNLACQSAGRNLTQSEWGQYLIGLPYAVTCDELPPQASAVPSLLEQAEELIEEGNIGGANRLYEQVVSAVLRSTDTGLATMVCDTAAETEDEGLVATLVPACEWAAELVVRAENGRSGYSLCEAGQGNTATEAAVLPACEGFAGFAMAERSLSDAYEICTQGTQGPIIDNDIAEWTQPVCEAIPGIVATKDNGDEVFNICRLSVQTGQDDIAGAVCGRMEELASDDLNDINYCLNAIDENLRAYTADICRAGFVPYVTSEPYFVSVLECLDIGQIQAGSETVHACGLMAEAARENSIAFGNHEICNFGLQESPDLAAEFLPACMAAVELDPGNGLYYGAYGVALSLIGDEEGAIQALNTYYTWVLEFEDEAEQSRASTLLEQVEGGTTADPLLLSSPDGVEQTEQ